MRIFCTSKLNLNYIKNLEAFFSPSAAITLALASLAASASAAIDRIN